MSSSDGIEKQAKAHVDSLVTLLGLQDIVFGGAFLYVSWTLNGEFAKSFSATPYEAVNVALLVIASALVGKLHSLANATCAGVMQALLLRVPHGELKKFKANMKRASELLGVIPDMSDRRIRGSDIDSAMAAVRLLAPQLYEQVKTAAQEYQTGYSGFLASLITLWYATATHSPLFILTAISIAFLLYAVSMHIDFLYELTRSLGFASVATTHRAEGK